MEQPVNSITSKLRISCGVFDALSSYVASSFADYLFISGLSLSATQFFEVDSGLHSIERVVSLAHALQALPSHKPVIADIDDAFGDYTLAGLHAKRLVKAGVFGVVIEDQSRPRQCGHKAGKSLHPIQNYIDGLHRIRQAEPSIFIVARTDAETDHDIKERTDILNQLFIDKVIDAVQIDGIRTLEQIATTRSRLSKEISYVANHVDGGKLEKCSLQELRNAGVDILTLSTFVLTNYIESLKGLRGRLDAGVLPTCSITLAEIDAILQPQ
jgi:2-methylisocitrate lyase-like PEP mutase family enzyme